MMGQVGCILQLFLHVWTYGSIAACFETEVVKIIKFAVGFSGKTISNVVALVLLIHSS